MQIPPPPSPRLDLVSDTATQPVPAMKQAMLDAALGDEQKGEDPTVAALEARVAALLGQERALFLPSATMGNQIALALHAQAGDEVIAHRSAHVINHEGGGTTMTSRAQLFPLDTPRGIFGVEDVIRATRIDDPHFPRTRAVVVENTSNGGGGTVWPLALLDDVFAHCARTGLAVHVDGARLWHAAAALGVAPARLCTGATTVQVCFSKGLGCPTGAILALPSSLWPRARRLKQALGGSMRQAGMLAGAMSWALDHHVARLVDDHRRARALAEGLAAIPGVSVEPVETNLVFFSTTMDAANLRARLLDDGIRIGGVAGSDRQRACVHLHVDDDAVAQLVASVSRALASPAART